MKYCNIYLSFCLFTSSLCICMCLLIFSVECMAGDVNLFFTDTDCRHSAEIEVMVAG